MKAKYTCITAQGGEFCIDGDTCEACDDIIGRCEQFHDVEIDDIINEEVLGEASMDEILAEIANEGPEIEDEMLAETEEDDKVEMYEDDAILYETICVPDGMPASMACFE